MTLILRHLGIQPYETTWHAMQRFTERRDAETLDELWLLEHPPVYTLGLNGKREHILAPGDIPIVQTDRGGQVTYHGPGQLIIYLLLDLRRKNLGVRALVSALEQAVVETAGHYGISAHARRDAPGVYVGAAKLASVGLRIRRHCSYHGLAVNVAMDLTPFQGINPCGYQDLKIVQFSDLDGAATCLETSVPIISALMQILDYRQILRAPPSP